MDKETLLKYFEYDRNLGQLIWKNHWSKSFKKSLIGTVVTSSNKRGYLSVQIEGKKYKVHRLIWFLENQDWPKEIDHIDGNKKNNTIANLRRSSRRLNMQNRASHRKGRLVGAYYHKKAEAWVAQIVINKKNFYLGLHSTEHKAHLAYMRKLHELGANQ